MDNHEYRQFDAVGLAEAIRAGDLTVREVTEAAIERAEAVNPTLNAICHERFSRAMQQTDAGDGPFSGVPFLCKDLAQEEAGEPCTMGSRGLLKQVADVDSAYVARAKAAGLNILGRTTTPELGLKAATESRLWGATRNPWDTSRTPGGSSGGSGAAVAAGVVPMAGANDGGGSIRIPAAYNGLFGLKPSRGRLSAGPQNGEYWTGASADLVVSRTVRDSAAMLDVLAGPESGDPFSIPVPETSWFDAIREAPRPLRIGVFTASPYGTDVAPECVEAVESTARTLEGLGHQVDYARPEIDGQALARCYLGLYFGEVSAIIDRAKEQYGAREADFELDTRLIGMLGRTLPLPDYVRMRQRWNEFARALGQFFGTWDLYLCPTTGQGPARIGELDTPGALQFAERLMLMLRAGKLVHRSGVVDQMAMDNLARTPFTQLANLTGTPAMSVPTHWSSGGLPVGVQFGAGHGQETVLLQLAAQLEQAMPWFDRYGTIGL